MESKIYVIHENADWTAPLFQALEELGAPYEDWFLDEGQLDLNEVPPEGIFYNRISASSHTRGHRFAPEFTAAVLSWLERNGRRVLNPSRALRLELSKAEQYGELNAHGIRTPKTIAAAGKNNILEAAKTFPRPFITKHNRAGKGLGVRLFHDPTALETYVNGPDFEDSVDGITLLQEYIESPDASITRCEFVGGQFLYAVKVDTSDGFELCPADACAIDDAHCPTTGTPTSKFEIIPSFESPLIEKYERFLKANDIHFAGIEFIENGNGDIYTYDVNTNTNYNSEAEKKDGRSGMMAIAETLVREWEQVKAFLSE
ncbi:MAG TPA: alpha-L-glutamate ligase [Bacillales bacterium]|nr:alpha-L-glutamate ligase [Bacillales bacterium]